MSASTLDLMSDDGMELSTAEDSDSWVKPRGLTALPTELLVQICRHLFKSGRWKRPYLSSDVASMEYHFPIAPLHVNKQLRDVAKLVFYDENIWMVVVCYLSVYNQIYEDDLSLYTSSLRFHVHDVHIRYRFETPPPYSVDKCCTVLCEISRLVCQTLAELPSLKRVIISWYDTRHAGDWSAKKHVLESLKLLPKTCSFTVMHYHVEEDSERSPNRGKFMKYLNNLLQVECIDAKATPGNRMQLPPHLDLQI